MARTKISELQKIAWGSRPFTGPVRAPVMLTALPIQVGLATFSSEISNDYHLLMAAATLAMLPVAVLYLFAQRQFTEGVVASGVKG